MTSPEVGGSVLKQTSIPRKMPTIASLTCWRSPSLTAMSSRCSSTPNGLRSRMSKACSSKSL